ncbi:MAG: NAD(P)-dependent oxidoreductase [Devosia sp.]|nr:NAD(P)-dependent oxidoreductase [Devosia sp.]
MSNSFMPQKPVRVGFACNEETYERMATPQAVATLSALGPFSHHLCNEPSAWELAPPRNPVAIDALVEYGNTVDALLVCHGAPRLTAEILDRLPHLKFVAEVEGDRFSQRIDLPAAAVRGVTVVDTTNGSSYPVAEWALAMAMIGLRNAGSLFRRMIDGEVPFKNWTDRVVDPGFNGELSGRKVGLIGCGYIGRRLLELLGPFHCDIYAYDPYAPRVLADIYDITLTSMQQVMQQDVVISLVPLTSETHHMVTAVELDLLRPGAVFVNVSRGAVVDPEALVARLQRGDVVASLDVFEPEPLPAESPLRQMPNVFMTPHIAGVTAPCGPRFLTLAADEIARYFAGHRTRHDLVARAAVTT